MDDTESGVRGSPITVWRQLLVNGLISGSSLGLLAVSFAIIYQTARFFHFAHASVYTVAAYIAYLFNRSLNLPLFIAIAISILLTSIAGWLIYATTYLPIIKRQASSTSLLLVSLGLMVAIQNVVAMCFGDELKTLSTGPIAQGTNIGGALITSVQAITILCSASAVILLVIFLQKTQLGLSLRSVADNSQLALVIGIDPDKVTGSAFAVGSALAAISSVLAAFDTGLTPTMGFNALLLAVVAVVLGGVGSIPGALLGGFAIGMIRNLVAAFIPTAWLDSMIFLVLIGFLLFRPYGLLGELPVRR